MTQHTHTAPHGPGNFYHALDERGLVAQATHKDALISHLADPSTPRRAYVGFDPTADSLTIGNLVGIMNLARFQRAGHIPFALMGGGTGLIGDPSGKSAERTLQTRDTVAHNVERIKRIFTNVIDFSPSLSNRAVMVNNLDWLGAISYLDMLRDVGKHFSVNMMIQKDSVRERLTNRDQGISYTEFSYMILQAYDFMHLFREHGVTLQMGGSDQFGNIVVGMDLIPRALEDTIAPLRRFLSAAHGEHSRNALTRSELGAVIDGIIALDRIDKRSSPPGPSFGDIDDHLVKLRQRLSDSADAFCGSSGEQAQIGLNDIIGYVQYVLGFNLVKHHVPPVAFGLTWPLVTKADGGKFGKTETGAIWLTPERTSPYAYYQFWLNAADADVERFLKIYTFLTLDEIRATLAEHAKDPGQRIAQRKLAQEATRILHGSTEVERAEAAARALFSGEIANLPGAMLREIFADVPSSNHAKTTLSGEGVAILDALIATNLAQSKREAREFLQNGSVTVNGRKVGVDDRLKTADLLEGDVIALRRGKKNWHLTRWA